MHHVAHITFPVPTTTVQLYLRNRALLPGKKQLVATIEAKDPAGAVLEPDEVSWTFSKATNSPYCYVPPLETQGAHVLKPLVLDRPVAELTVRLAPWGRADVDTGAVIASLHYACSASRSASSTAPAISVAGVAEMEDVA